MIRWGVRLCFPTSMQFSPDRLVEIASTRLPEQYGDLRRDGLARLLDQVTDPTTRCMFSGLDATGVSSHLSSFFSDEGGEQVVFTLGFPHARKHERTNGVRPNDALLLFFVDDRLSLTCH